ncbi:MAG: hypothetical protein UY99_C0029G0006 [Parcubacteria group bacterium GW2011_GWA1_59_11]|nr:MAG: hypothetical protein UY99_C0029G0006 [Parcubacteria group bacterium GW2011_GWA1_59_11]
MFGLIWVVAIIAIGALANHYEKERGRIEAFMFITVVILTLIFFTVLAIASKLEVFWWQ